VVKNRYSIPILDNRKEYRHGRTRQRFITLLPADSR
jgi:hypothetical protein